MTRNSIQGAIANALWRNYEYSLPDTPFQMALVVCKQLEEEGYIEGDKNA